MMRATGGETAAVWAAAGRNALDVANRTHAESNWRARSIRLSLSSDWMEQYTVPRSGTRTLQLRAGSWAPGRCLGARGASSRWGLGAGTPAAYRESTHTRGQ